MAPKKLHTARKAPAPTKKQLADLNQELQKSNDALRAQLGKLLFPDTDELFAFDVTFECAVNHAESVKVPDPNRHARFIDAASPRTEYYMKTYTVLAASPGEALNATGPLFRAYLVGDVEARGLKVTDKETFVSASVKVNPQFIGQVNARGDVTCVSRPVQG